MILLTFMPYAAAQQTTPPTGGSGGGGGGGTTQPKTTPVIPKAPDTAGQPPELRNAGTPEIVFISGSVMQEDGNPPPFGTVIELDCGNTVTREAMVDSEGYYAFQVGSGYRIGRVLPDASDRIGEDIFDAESDSAGMGMREWPSILRTTPLHVRLRRCELRAQYPGYRSTTVRIRLGSIFGYAEVEPILIYRMSKVQGTSVSATSLLAPKEAKKTVEQAAKALKKERFDEAEELVKSALAAYSNNAEAWYLLGEACLFQQRIKEARESYLKAIGVDKMFVRPYIRLARISMLEGDWKSAVHFTDEALKLDPVSFPEAYYLNALASYNLADLETAERSARRGQRLDFDHNYPDLHLILANVLSVKQDAKGSIEEMRKYLKVATKGEHAAAVRARLEEKERPPKTEAK